MYSNVLPSDSVAAMLKQLKNPFNPKFVKCRIGATNKEKTKGIALFYVDAREVMKRLDDVCGMDGWSTDGDRVDGGYICKLSIRMPYLMKDDKEKWIKHTDIGESTKTSPLKGAASDALKRAAVHFGVGRYLYYIPNKWYPISNGKFTEKPELPKWALPDDNLEDWQNVAELEYNPEEDVGLDEVVFTDDEAKRDLEKGAEIRQSIIDNLEAKKND